MQVAPKSPEPRNTGEFGQVLQFPRGRAGLPPFAGPPARPADLELEPADDLARYEQDEPVDYRQRTLMNLIAVVIVTLLVAAGVWIADTIAGLDRDEDCVMQGRFNCAPIELPNRQ